MEQTESKGIRVKNENLQKSASHVRRFRKLKIALEKNLKLSFYVLYHFHSQR